MPLFDPATWPFPLELLPGDAYLVGGSVRDRLLNRTPTYLDLDFVLPADTLKTSARIARKYKAGYVVLSKERQIARLVFEHMTVDFAQRQGDHAAEDLSKRDFTVNAIAYCPRTHTLIDPLEGQVDLSARRLRMVKRENLAADAIRLLRGYRQSAQLGFEVEPETQQVIAELAPHLALVATERIRSELDALLSVAAGTHQLQSILHSNLLAFHLPHFNQRSIEQVIAIDCAFDQLTQAMPDYAQQLRGWTRPVPMGCDRSWIKAAKLSRMLSHNPQEAQATLELLKYSRNESRTVLALVKAQHSLPQMQRFDRAQQFFLYKLVGSSFPAFSLLALANGIAIDVLQPMIAQFQDPTSELAHPKTLITGTMLIKQLGIQPGPDVGALLSAVEQAQARGHVRSPQEAIAFAKTLC